MPTSWRHRRRRWRTLSNPKLQSSTRFEYHILSSHDRSCFPSKNILMLLLLQGQGGAPAGDDGGDEDEMDKDELWASSPLKQICPPPQRHFILSSLRSCRWLSSGRLPSDKSGVSFSKAVSPKLDPLLIWRCSSVNIAKFEVNGGLKKLFFYSKAQKSLG